MQAVMVCVDYSDLLTITMPYNKHHFEQVHVVTSSADVKTQQIAAQYGAQVWITDSFYADGATFNKFRALEESLDRIGRQGWLCLMDADVLWPRELPDFGRQVGYLYTPRRRMFLDVTKPVPHESQWKQYDLHRQEVEFAGYSQIFHASDPGLPPAPWHQTNWKHAGGADSFFQMLWPNEKKIRPPFEVLHLGPAGENWCGRASILTDGTTPDESAARQQQLAAFRKGRRYNQGADPFQHEKISLPVTENKPAPLERMKQDGDLPT